MIFVRGDYTSVFIRITSDETLGILDTDYLEDYNGIHGQVTLRNTDTSQAWPITMTAQPAETPGIDNDVFLGQKLLADIPDGNYAIQGRCRDLIGNYTIIGEVQTPIGGEDVIDLEFEIVDQSVIVTSVYTQALNIIEARSLNNIYDNELNRVHHQS